MARRLAKAAPTTVVVPPPPPELLNSYSIPLVSGQVLVQTFMRGRANSQPA
jgi:hypothetical protein